MIRKTIFFALLLSAFFACSKEDKPEFSGTWMETTSDQAFIGDSAGVITDTLTYQATLTLEKDGSYQCQGERPFGIGSKGTWVREENPERLVFQPTPPLPGFVTKPVTWEVVFLDAERLLVKQTYVHNFNGQSWEDVDYRDFTRQ